MRLFLLTNTNKATHEASWGTLKGAMLAQKALPQRSQSLPDGDEGVAALGGTEVNGVSPTYKGSLICPLQRQINQLFFTKRKQNK